MTSVENTCMLSISNRDKVEDKVVAVMCALSVKYGVEHG